MAKMKICGITEVYIVDGFGKYLFRDGTLNNFAHNTSYNEIFTSIKSSWHKTRAEAIETCRKLGHTVEGEMIMLKGYLVPVFQNKELYNALLIRLQLLGWENTNNSKYALEYNNGYLALCFGGNGNKPGTIGWSMGDGHSNWVSLNITDIFKDDTYKYIKPTKEVQLNSEYKAIVNAEGVTVGCQKFSIDKLKELVKAAKEYGYEL